MTTIQDALKSAKTAHEYAKKAVDIADEALDQVSASLGTSKDNLEKAADPMRPQAPNAATKALGNFVGLLLFGIATGAGSQLGKRLAGGGCK